MTKMTKPKRWTWEELEQQDWEDMGLLVYSEPDPKAFFRVNDPLLDWQEKRIEELQSEASVSVMLAAMQTAKRVDAEIIENYELQQCQETIAKLKEALEFYADPKNWGNQRYGHSEINDSDMGKYLGEKEFKGGKRAREALKEIGDEKA